MSSTSPQLRRSATEPQAQSSSNEIRPGVARTVSFNIEEGEAPPTKIRWGSDLADRLEYSKKQLYRAQKKWSAEQELWIEEVESLRRLKKESDKFYARRQKASRKEGLTFRQEVGRSRAFAELDEMEDAADADDEDDSPATQSLNRTISAFPGLALTISSTSSRGSSHNGSRAPSRKSSVVQDLIRGNLFRRETS